MKTLVTLPKIKELLGAFEKANVNYMVIAGFGLDGLRGHQTRPHQDVDILCLKKDAKKIEKVTSDLGYEGEWFQDLYKIKRKDGSKADLAMATAEGDELVTYGRIAITRFPQSLFKPQTGKIEDLEFKIAPNELLKTYALHATKGEDKAYADTIPVDSKLIKKIHRVLRTPPQTAGQSAGHEL
jgi:hypothetical protein